MIRRFKLIFYYIISEMVPTFFVGVISFVSILLMFQMLKLTDEILQHDVSLRTIIHLLSYMSISFLPAILPMSLIFAIVLSYNRLTADSEITAMKALGMSMWPIITPGIFLGLCVALLSGYTSFKVGPWGNRQFELLMHDIGSSKIIAKIGEGQFSSGFFNLVVYTNKKNNNTNELENVFIYDERDPESPTTIIAEKGKIVSEKTFDSLKAFVRLTDGDIHKISDNGHTKIRFKTYDLQIIEPNTKQTRDKSMESLTFSDLNYLLKNTDEPAKHRKYLYEWHKRFSLSFACILFVLMGIGLGCKTHSRSGKSGGGVISVGVIVAYWVLFVIGNSLTKSTAMPVWIGAWFPAFILLPTSLYLVRKNWN